MKMLVSAVLLLIFGSLQADAASGVETSGDILQFILPGAAAGLTFLYRDREGALQFGESAALTVGLTYSLKYSVDEIRPNGGKQSFPSGHSSISFSAAEFMRKRYGWGYGIPAYALASCVAYSRVESREHYAHDVIAGASIGIVSSYIFTRPYHGWSVEAQAGINTFGLNFSRQW